MLIMIRYVSSKYVTLHRDFLKEIDKNKHATKAAFTNHIPGSPPKMEQAIF